MTSPVRTGLAALKEYQADQARRAEERERPKAEWFRWTVNGQKDARKIDTVQARFMNEWDESSDVFAKWGAPILAVEHQAPGDQGFKYRALCTIDTEGECYGCQRHEMRIESDKGQWKQRTNFYINALVDFGEAKKVVIMNRNANASFVDDLLTELEDEGNISGANYRIKVTGEKTTTKWGLKRQKEVFDFEGYEAYDLEEMALRKIPYAEQRKYYGNVYTEPGAEPAADDSSAGSSNVDETW